MVRWQDDDELLAPMPPPPAPQAHPQDRDKITPRYRKPYRTPVPGTDEELTPQTPPTPHTHPLVSLSDESARNVKLQQDAGGMAICSSERIFRHRTVISGKRLDSTFLSYDRVEAFLDRVEVQASDSQFAVETEHSSRAIAMQWQQQIEEAEKKMPKPALDEQAKTMAATEASDRRHDLLRSGDEDLGASKRLNGHGSALARASERKVRKQLDAKWVQSRQDPSNRPRKPLERPEEKDLRETLFRTTASDLLQSGVLYGDDDLARCSTFEPMGSPRMPIVSNGIIGLPGCCFENY